MPVHALRWTSAAGMTSLPALSGYPWMSAAAVSADGTIIVGTATPSASSGTSRAFRWTGGVTSSLGTLPGDDFSRAVSISGNGSTILGSSDGSGSSAVIWRQGAATVDLNAYLPLFGIDLTGWHLEGAGLISADGRIALAGGMHNGHYEACLIHLPCYANCDGSTAPPSLNISDFACFLDRFAGGDPYANCDGSTTDPVLSVQDFTCFLNAFAAGCP
jgi:probable HAF family extracellular repeat protein